ncbi:MAG TPA: ABC transporter ATP-binding protein [Candidatus Paceibacterota bacterium]|jgi:ABC-2 type transport system ATP-binding protein|nr:ABC transporter ATP-binding protein [Candidatus Paceibacterota bacterium]HPQ23010.1 ABC transporter ATP-binding protein [Candidatus Paceibacterota bacterium]
MSKVIEVKNLVKDYENFRALKGISFEVEEGEIFGLIGPNAAGKTTTLRIIATLIQPTNGEVEVFNYNVVKDPEKVREKISYLPEEAGAYKNLSGKEYLDFIARFYAKDKNEIKEILTRGLELAKLGEKITNKVSTYSKGMTRRLLIARALMAKPKLAILDEPTSGLDVIISREIREIIKNFAQQGTTVLLSSHNMLEVEFLCDRIALIDKGEIKEIGTPEKLKEEYDAKNIEDVFIKAVK